MSTLVAKIAQLKEWDVYIIEIIQSASSNCNVSCPEPPSVFCCYF
jgi:hypothetical protein